MALANIAVLLAQRGLRVLAVDWDLEAPGLHRYFQELKIEMSSQGGLLELLTNVGLGEEISAIWRDYCSSVTVNENTKFSLMAAGRFDSGYNSRVLQFDWHEFFRNHDGAQVLESLRGQWSEDFDITLIDGRTGITDSGGICTVQMPDVLVLVFSANRQSLDGAKEVALKAQTARQKLAYDRTRLQVFPLPSRFDTRTEFRESQRWLKIFEDELAEFYADWLPKNVTVQEILERTKLPYVAYFSFGEKLPVVTDGTTDPESLGFAYENAAKLIATNFRDPIKTLALSSTHLPRRSFDEATVPDPSEVDQRYSSALDAASLAAKPSFALTAVPSRKLDLIELVESQESDLVKLIQHPPELRKYGFDLNTGSSAVLISNGQARRSRSHRKLLELWRDGCLIFVADGESFLCRDINKEKKQRPFPLLINTLVLSESTLLFCELAKQIYSKAIPRARSIQLGLRFSNLVNDEMPPVLVPSEIDFWGSDGHSYEAESGEGRFSLTVDIDEDSAVAAWRLISQIYVWFGIEHDKIPYTIRDGGPARIDRQKIASLRRGS